MVMNAQGTYMKLLALVFAGPEEKQEVTVHVIYQSFSKFFGERSHVKIQQCKIEQPLALTPSDLNGDIERAVAEMLGEREQDVMMECKPKYGMEPVIVIPIKKSYATNMLFI
jgi:hypothetical protein